jgi:hypothetical protein
VADTQVSERPRAAASHSVRVEPGTGMRGRVSNHRKASPPQWRAVVLCALLVAAVGLLAYAVTVTDGDAVAEFYQTPPAFTPGEPGDVIKIEQLDAGPVQGALYRVMYHSRSIRGRDIPVTGSLAVPTSPAPIGGYPVVSVGHPTLGNADECAPSREPTAQADLINRFLAAGWIVATSDYEGLGTPGVPPYLVGESEARSMIDIVRAARGVPAFSAGTAFATWGHSQGGHASLFARKVAARYAPELRMVGAVAVAPVSSASTFVSRANFAGPGLTLMTVSGYAATYDLSPSEVLTRDGMDHLDDAGELCLGELGEELGDRTLADVRRTDPTTLPDWGEALSRNDAGPIRSNVAVLLQQGDQDAIVPLSDTQSLFQEMCATAQPVQLQIDPGADHSEVRDNTLGDGIAWLTDRFNLDPAPINCGQA